MNKLQIFDYNGKQVRTVKFESGEPGFVAKDICNVLEIGDISKAVSRLDEDEKGTNLVRTPGGNQSLLCVTESGLYSLVLGSRKPGAKEFKRWITHEILPAIRKHGGYLTPEKLEEVLLSPDTLIRLATDLKTEREARLFAERELQHKTQVITSLTEGITPPEKRQMLNRVVRRVPNYKHRWAELYRQFELKYHMNLGVRAKGGSKLEYIDGVLGQLDDLYDIACKLYESDMRKLVEELYRLREEAI